MATGSAEAAKPGTIGSLSALCESHSPQIAQRPLRVGGRNASCSRRWSTLWRARGGHGGRDGGRVECGVSPGGTSDGGRPRVGRWRSERAVARFRRVEDAHWREATGPAATAIDQTHFGVTRSLRCRCSPRPVAVRGEWRSGAAGARGTCAVPAATRVSGPGWGERRRWRSPACLRRSRGRIGVVVLG
jgi:hypothetical protein